MWASEFDHHPDAAVDELLDFVLLLLSEDAWRDDAGVVELFNIVQRADDGIVLQIRLAILKHRGA